MTSTKCNISNPCSCFSSATLSNYVNMMQMYNANSILQLMYYEHAVNNPPWLSSDPADPITFLPVDPLDGNFNPVGTSPVERPNGIGNDFSIIGKVFDAKMAFY